MVGDRSPSRRNGRMHQVMPEDVKLVCAHGHTMWYTHDAVIVDLHGCDMTQALIRGEASMRCGTTLRQLTEAEEAAYAIGGFGAVEEIVRSYAWREITHICWRGHVMTTQAVPPPGTGGCPRKVFSKNVHSWLVCGTAVRPMLMEELAAYRLGGEDAVKALYPDRELVQWPWA